MIVNSGSDIVGICQSKGITIAELAIEHEMLRSSSTHIQVHERMNQMYEHMIEPIGRYFGGNDNTIYHGQMVKDYGRKIIKYTNSNKSLLGDVAARAVAHAVSVTEANCAMGRVVASPTAGSCGVLPAAIVSCMDTHSVSKERAIDGLLTAGLVGVVIGRNATLAGAEGGCQAEIGSASAMASAAVVAMLGGTPEKCLDAGAYTLKNMMGLVCDPVAGLVEIPCIKRNGLGVLNALMCADMVLSGIESVIPFDEVVVTMGVVGRQMPVSLRETSEGGIADTPTARNIERNIFR